MTTMFDGARGRSATADGALGFHRLGWLAEQGIGDVERAARTPSRSCSRTSCGAPGRATCPTRTSTALAAGPALRGDIAFMPGRVLMQDFTGVPAVVDLAAMRSAVARAGGDPAAREPRSSRSTS